MRMRWVTGRHCGSESYVPGAAAPVPPVGGSPLRASYADRRGIGLAIGSASKHLSRPARPWRRPPLPECDVARRIAREPGALISRDERGRAAAYTRSASSRRVDATHELARRRLPPDAVDAHPPSDGCSHVALHLSRVGRSLGGHGASTVGPGTSGARCSLTVGAARAVDVVSHEPAARRPPPESSYRMTPRLCLPVRTPSRVVEAPPGHRLRCRPGGAMLEARQGQGGRSRGPRSQGAVTPWRLRYSR